MGVAKMTETMKINKKNRHERDSNLRQEISYGKMFQTIAWISEI